MAMRMCARRMVILILPPVGYSLRVLRLVSHPIVHDCLAQLRDKDTPPGRFRELATRISVLLGAEALKDLPQREVVIQTPLGPAPGHRVAVDVVLAPVLRAG